MNVTILVTGASGFVGLNLLEQLVESGEAVIALSLKWPIAEIQSRFAGRPGHVLTIEGDVRDRRLVAAIFADHAITRVIHGAVVTANAAREMREPEQVLSVNLDGLAVVLSEAARHGAERFVLMSSIGVYGTTPADGALLDEALEHSPATLYGITKSAGEAIALRLAGLHGLDCIIARLGVVFGPYEHRTGLRDTMSAPYCITGIAQRGGEAVLPRDASKNWHYARDAASSLVRLLMSDRHEHIAYNLGPSEVWRLSAWCQRLQERYPAFRWRIADGPGDAVGIWTARDGGVLSGGRFADEFGPTARLGIDAAFHDYMAFLDDPRNAAFSPRPV